MGWSVGVIHSSLLRVSRINSGIGTLQFLASQYPGVRATAVLKPAAGTVTVSKSVTGSGVLQFAPSDTLAAFSYSGAFANGAVFALGGGGAVARWTAPGAKFNTPLLIQGQVQLTNQPATAYTFANVTCTSDGAVLDASALRLTLTSALLAKCIVLG
jgi:hypothetical protein